MIYLAEKTAELLKQKIEADQGAAYRQWLGRVIGHMDDAFRGADPMPFRSHMGASLLGGKCGRAIWYGFRWAKAAKFDARILRLFNRGHLEEARFIACLLTIGCEVYQQDENGKQFRISWAGGHCGGSTDGVVVGIPDLPPGTPCLTEFKTHSDKSFQKLKKEGVRVSKPEHYVQMCLYMKKRSLPAALYGAVNKNDDEIYWELIPRDDVTADQYLERGEKLVFFRTPPEKISNSPGWFECRWCDFNKICHTGASVEHNCRTCKWSLPRDDGTALWVCIEPDAEAAFGDSPELSVEEQYKGCPKWAPIQGLSA